MLSFLGENHFGGLENVWVGCVIVVVEAIVTYSVALGLINDGSEMDFE